MSNSFLITPEDRPFVKPIGRRKLLLTGAVAGAGLIMPRMSWAATGGCDALSNILSQSQEQSTDARPWTRENGAVAATRLEMQIYQARKKLDEAIMRETKLDRALLVDIISLVGGAAFFATGFVAAGTFTATTGAVLLTAGVLFNSTMFIAQLTTNSEPPDNFTLATGDGSLNLTLDELGKHLEGVTTAASKNVGKYMALAGKLLGTVTLALTAKETWDTYSESSELDLAVQQLREGLAELEPQLADLRDQEAMNELRQASAMALAEDLAPYSQSECTTPSKMPKRKKRLKLIQK